MVNCCVVQGPSYIWFELLIGSKLNALDTEVARFFKGYTFEYCAEALEAGGYGGLGGKLVYVGCAV